MAVRDGNHSSSYVVHVCGGVFAAAPASVLRCCVFFCQGHCRLRVAPRRIDACKRERRGTAGEVPHQVEWHELPTRVLGASVGSRRAGRGSGQNSGVFMLVLVVLAVVLSPLFAWEYGRCPIATKPNRLLLLSSRPSDAMLDILIACWECSK